MTNINNYAPASGRVIKENGDIVNWADLITVDGLQVTGISGGGGGGSLSDVVLQDSTGVLVLQRDNGSTRTYLRLDTGASYTPTLPLTAPTVSGPLTDAQLRAAPVEVSGGLTDTELRASSLHVTPSNITTKFREAFEVLNTSTRWNSTVGTGDIVQVDGNAAGASYLVISKSPWNAGQETRLETIPTFSLPIELAFGAHMSQRTLGQEF